METDTDGNISKEFKSEPLPDVEPTGLDSTSEQESPSKDAQAIDAPSSEPSENVEELQAKLEDLEKRRSGEKRQINELTETVKSLQSRLEPEPEEVKPVFGEEQEKYIQSIVQKSLQSDESVAKMAAQQAKQDEADLKTFQAMHPDAFTGESLEDLDTKVAESLDTFMKANPNRSLKELLEKAYIDAKPQEYVEFVQKGGLQAADNYRDRQFVGGGAAQKSGKSEPKYSTSELEFLRKMGVQPK